MLDIFQASHNTIMYYKDIKLSEEGVNFASPYDWSKHMFTPENVVDTQCDFGSDIMMVLDVCSPADADKDTIHTHMWMTHRWARRAFEHLEPKYNNVNWVLFPIVQGGSYKDLREELWWWATEHTNTNPTITQREQSVRGNSTEF